MVLGAAGQTMDLVAKAVEEGQKPEPGETLEIAAVYTSPFLGVARTQDHRVVGKPVQAAASNWAIAISSAVVYKLFLTIHNVCLINLSSQPLMAAGAPGRHGPHAIQDQPGELPAALMREKNTEQGAVLVLAVEQNALGPLPKL